MVKKLIKSIVGKKEDEDNSEDIPDELPPLAEDLASEDSASDEQSEIVKEFKEIESKSEETPKKNIDSEEIKEEEKPANAAKKDNKEKIEEIKEDIKSPFTDKQTGNTFKEKLSDSLPKEPIKLEEEIVEKEEQKEILPKPDIKSQNESSEKIYGYTPHVPKQNKEKGFFSELLELTELQGIPNNLLKEDLFRRMKDYWYYHPHGKEKLSKNDIEKKVSDELLNLKRLEDGWIAQKNFLEEDKRILLEKQQEIISRTKKLQLLINQLKIFENVHPKNYFWLNNEIAIKNLHELMNLLEVIDDETFKFHVHSRKNDFSEWIKHAVGDHNLADKIQPIKTKEEMLIVLENAALGNLYAIKPDQYFKMENNVIRDLKELINSLKETNDEIFHKHVNKEKNDFSNWIRGVYKNDFLADRLLQAQTRQKTIEILEDFFKS